MRLKIVDHLANYDYISDLTVQMEIYNSTYQLADGDPGAATLTDSFTNDPSR
jgi:hypothetical protein